MHVSKASMWWGIWKILQSASAPVRSSRLLCVLTRGTVAACMAKHVPTSGSWTRWDSPCHACQRANWFSVQPQFQVSIPFEVQTDSSHCFKFQTHSKPTCIQQEPAGTRRQRFRPWPSCDRPGRKLNPPTPAIHPSSVLSDPRSGWGFQSECRMATSSSTLRHGTEPRPRPTSIRSTAAHVTPFWLLRPSDHHTVVSSDRLTVTNVNVTLKQSAEQRDAHAEAEPLVHAGTELVNTHAHRRRRRCQQRRGRPGPCAGRGCLSDPACRHLLPPPSHNSFFLFRLQLTGHTAAAQPNKTNQPPTGDWWVFV